MKNLYFLLLFVSGMAFAQPAIQQPSNVYFCDDNNDGYGIFDFTMNDELTLGPLDPSSHTIGYFETLSNAQNFTGAIVNPANYVNIVPFNQTIYAAVYENSSPLQVAVATFQIITNPYPMAGTFSDYIIYENPNDGVALFDLTTQSPSIIGGQSGSTVFYYTTEADAAAGINPISTAVPYQNTSNPEQIWFRLSNMATGCFSLGSFNLVVVSSEAIYIPDPVFKNQLLVAGPDGGTFILGSDGQPVLVDVNGDGEIQYSEALLLYAIDLPQFAISSLVGIEHFLNLRRLSVLENNLTTVNLLPLTNLEYLDLSGNNFGTLDIHTLTNLKQLHVSEMQLSSLEVTGFPQLEILHCSNNLLSTLDLSGLTNLELVSCYGNNIETIDLTAVQSLQILFCGANEISALDLSDTTQLQILDCSENNITSLDFAGLTNLTTLSVDYNPITSLDITPLQSLTNFSAFEVLLTTFDASNNPNLCNYISVTGPNLEYVNVKNGNACTPEYTFSDSPNLQFVCADDSEVQVLANYFFAMDMDVNVNSYCSFTPGGNYNTITGTVRIDVDNNGCDANDPVFPFVNVGIEGIEGTGMSFTNQDGSYTFYTQAGDFTLTPIFEIPDYFTVIPSVTVNFPTVDNSVMTQNFCIVPNGVHQDLEIAIASITPARPGFDAVYKIVYKNKGNQVMSQDYAVNFFYNEILMDFVSSDPPADQQVSGGLSYNYADLMPFESRSVLVTLSVNAPTDANPVNIGDVLGFNAVIAPVGTDETPVDNNFIFNQTVVGAYDPNDKICMQGDIVSPTQIGEYLHYVINFENTGNFYAQNVIVRDIINEAQFDVTTLQILDASHPVRSRLNGNVAEFYFENINLDSGGHGNILLKIKTLSSLVTGDMVSNKADIFFDYNFPIETNDANTTFQTLKVGDHGSIDGLSVYPNPSSTQFTVHAEETIESVQLYDVQGRLLQSSITQGQNVEVDISQRSIGVYFLKVVSHTGSATVKIIKD